MKIGDILYCKKNRFGSHGIIHQICGNIYVILELRHDNEIVISCEKDLGSNKICYYNSSVKSYQML